MTPVETEALAARVLAAIDYREQYGDCRAEVIAADRERVASDLAGLRRHHGWHPCVGSVQSAPQMGCQDARRYEAGLRRTARLYPVREA